MEDQIKMLVELQELDAEIYNRKRLLDAIPERIKELDDSLEQKSEHLKSLEEESKNLQVKRKQKETDLASKEETIRKYKTQLFQIKTNKEYTSLEKEIAGIKADNSILEDEILGFFEEIDEIKKKVSKEREDLESEKGKIKDEKKAIEDEKKVNEAEFNNLKNKRKEFTGKLDKSVLSKYERILNNREGLAMVRVVHDSCGGCNMNLPPQVINEAKLKKELIFCGNCARILYTE
jgi:predicted  nucleic acid-binding Zn-ribbon protein